MTKLNGKHTPGPWCFHGQHSEIHSAIDENGNQVIADMNSDNDFTREVNAANARLIASAPDLLAALDALVQRCVSLDRSATHEGMLNCEAMAHARTAIARARGE